MDSPAHNTLVRAVADILAAGLPQDEAVAHFIRSTHGDLPPDALAALLADPGDPQAASLIELLLFPGEAVALALEPALAAARPDEAEAALLAEELAGRVTRAVAVLPDGSRLVVPLSPDDVRRFVGRLAPTRTLPGETAALLAARFGPDAALSLAVAARQTGPDWTPGAASFFRSLAERLPGGAPNASEILRYVLRFLAGLPAGALPLPALVARRGQLSAQLRRARLQEETLAKSNFETLLLTGARLPYLHAPDIRRELDFADAAILAVTGRPAPDTLGSCLDLGTFSDMDGMLAALGDPER
ncbi:hypothetical protein DFW101_0375 [Solidesulfovibrio carbinoliphilus subsp. oakridgensis]|uniref:Uncharacterized protein n=1 Tax=Solidesulfovibrio carbinoliphilus subsp. oakridgensis TaxID=694327 RepID=G7QD86_9BACT|nr:hypothetical protein [Solidesulfovibrio carbinoliphilus]EHJ46392.1 hypothetical protein DFW101_0375 [Solidesulfovibrio carbinoliphilus subsp. oakridgensis]